MNHASFRLGWEVNWLPPSDEVRVWDGAGAGAGVVRFGKKRKKRSLLSKAGSLPGGIMGCTLGSHFLHVSRLRS